MYRAFAPRADHADQLGIRRRLAPLVANESAPDRG